MSPAKRLAGVSLTFIGAVMFSTKAIMVKLAYRDAHMDAILLLALRMLCSMPFFLIAAWWASDKQSEKLSLRQWGQVVLLGIVGYYLSSWFDFLGLQFISAGLERLILFLYPSFTALINLWFFKQALGKRQKWALLLTYIGLAIAYFGEFRVDSANPNFLLGSFLIFLCSITYAFYIAGSGRMIPKLGVTRYTAYNMLAATGGIFLHFALTRHIMEVTISPDMWKFGLLVAIIATVIPSFLISAGMKRIGSNNAAIVSSIGPVSTIIQAHFFLGEQIHGAQILGTILVISGVLLIGWKHTSDSQDQKKQG